MDLTLLVKSAENQYKQILEEYFISVFGEKKLPSHDLQHHRRVWKIAGNLIKRITEETLARDPQIISSLIIACYLHDLGMVIDHGPRHGRYSHDLCKRFLDKHNLDESVFPGLLKAILDHDNKDYSKPDGINLQTLLSVADDLDAFGYIGIYRYIEIYILRDVPAKDLASAIRENAGKRFYHFKELFSDESELVTKHYARYRVLDDFFRDYDTQVKNKVENNSNLEIVDIVTEMVKNRADLHALTGDYEKSEDKTIRWFFTNLKSDLDLSVR